MAYEKQFSISGNNENYTFSVSEIVADNKTVTTTYENLTTEGLRSVSYPYVTDFYYYIGLERSDIPKREAQRDNLVQTLQSVGAYNYQTYYTNANLNKMDGTYQMTRPNGNSVEMSTVTIAENVVYNSNQEEIAQIGVLSSSYIKFIEQGGATNMYSSDGESWTNLNEFNLVKIAV